ncbi:MAG: response regulator [gamma proteobacterium symbiont of Taylorina sp.]|nr:response regulator [gamma proteobacterium symbiont of Taylorina sp.]
MTDVRALKSLAVGIKILYVEDDEELRHAIGLYLKKIFTQVDIAEDGQQGLEQYYQHDYDIVITDIHMPNMNGLEMVKGIKTFNEEQEVIIVSAYSDASYFIDAIRLGITGYIIKPVDYAQMNATLYKTVRKLVAYKENNEYKDHLVEMVEQRTKALLALEDEKIKNYENTIMAFIEMVEDRDTYTGGHSQRVAHYCKLVAGEMGYSKEECELIYHAGILHDIGKIATPDTVLLKPGKLSGLEYKLIQQHVSVSYALISRIPMYKKLADIVIYHHEKHDGTGYPQGVKGDDIPELARIMIVADAFDAMTTNRIYKGRKDIATAVEELKALSGKQFHPTVVQSAVIVLATIKLDDSASQMPVTELEKERFAYFYSDQITSAYNTDYLNFILNHNSFDKEYCCINLFYLHNFTQYNQKHGWSEGNNILNSLVDYLHTNCAPSMIFRIHGDDFVVLNKEHIDIDMNQFEALEVFKGNNLSISKRHIDLNKEVIRNLDELEALI